MAILKCMSCGGKVKTAPDQFTATCEYCGNEMTIFESTMEFEVDSKGVLVQYNGKGGDVTVPDNIRKIGPEAFRDNLRLFTVTLPDTIIEIGAQAFRDCTELEEINLPKNLETIGTEAFRGCQTLREITIPEGVLSIPVGLFIECYNLETVHLHDGIRIIEKSGFLECKKLKNLRLPQKLRKLGDYALDECTSLTELELPASLQAIGKQTFHKCSSVKKISIPDSVHTMGSFAFENCSSLTDVTLGAGLSELPEGTFKNCTSLAQITIPENIVRLNGYVFDNCTGLKTVHLPDTMQEINGHAFYGADALDGTLKIPASLPGLCLYAVKTKVKHLIIGKAVENIKFSNITFPALETVTVLEGVTALCDSAFRYCRNLKTVSLPSTLEAIGAHAFEDCDNLQTVNIPSNVTTLGAYAFADSGITNVVFDDPETAKLEAIEKETFIRCKRIKSIELPGSIRSIGDEAFLGCSALQTIRIGEGCRSIGKQAFCSTDCGARHFYLPGTIQAIGKDTFFSYRPTTFHSPKNTTIQNYCDTHDDCIWQYQPSKAEQQQQLLALRKAEQKKDLENGESSLLFERKKLVDRQGMLKLHQDELKTTNQQIQVLKNQLPQLTGFLKKGKRQKCEEELAICIKNREWLEQKIQSDKKDLEETQSRLQALQEKTAKMRSLL